MSQSGGILGLIAGAAEVAAGALIIAGTMGGGTPLGVMLIASGAMSMATGAYSIVAGDPVHGRGTVEKNPIAPWVYQYGVGRPTAILVYDQAWGADNKIRDIVAILAAHPIQSVDRILFDQQFILTTPSGSLTPLVGVNSSPAPSSHETGGGSGYLIGSISRSTDGIVTVEVPSAVPYLQAGDQVNIQGVSGDPSLNGLFPISQIVASAGGHVTSFTYVSGGSAGAYTGTGKVQTTWPNYGTNIYAEFSNGGGVPGQGTTQAQGTFTGMLVGTPWLGTGDLITPSSPREAGFGQGYNSGNPPINPWTPFCSLQGKAALALRISGNTGLFPSGLPLVSALIHGKNNIYDPRLGPCTGVQWGGFSSNGSGYQAGDILAVGGGGGGCHIQIVSVNDGILCWKIISPGVGASVGGPYATSYVSHTAGSGSGSGAMFNVSQLGGSTGTLVYTANSALCIADFINDRVVGYNIPYSDTTLFGEYIPTAALISAANICDQSVSTVIGGSEPLWSCNGRFDSTQRRGQILEDMLTSCAGRLTTVGGQYVILPAQWNGGSPVSFDLMANAAGPFKWTPTVSSRDLFNGVKGTYISPANKWQSTDFPRYAQDSDHGYSGPSQYGGDANLAADGGQRRWYDMHLPFTISSRQAQQTAKIELLRRRHWGSGTFRLNMSGYQFTPYDVMSATHSFLGWSGKFLEVSKSRFAVSKAGDKDKEVMVLSSEVDLQETDSSIYVWSTEEELSPQGYVQANWPKGQAAEDVCLPWSPGYVAPLPGDATFPQGGNNPTGPASFGLQPNYSIDAHGDPVVGIQVKGYTPINDLNTDISKPQVSAVGSASGGALADGNYVVAVSARDAGSPPYSNTDYLSLAAVTISGGGGNGSIAVTVAWGSGDDGGDLYVASLNPGTAYEQNNETSYVWHQNQVIPPGATQASVTVFDQTRPGGPDPLFDHFGVIWYKVEHGGTWADQIAALTANTLTFGGPGMTTNQWAGYVISLLAKYDPTQEVAILNLPILSSTASDPTTGEFTLTIGPNSAGVQIEDLTTLLAPLDLMVCRFNATFTPTGFSDPNVVNGYYPSIPPGTDNGLVVFVLTGEDAGDVQLIASDNGSGAYELAGAWAITPAAGDMIVVCDPTRYPEVPTASAQNSNGLLNGVVGTPTVQNIQNQTWLLVVRTEDASGNHGPDSLAPMRDVFLFGAQGTRTIATSQTMLPTDQVIECDATAGDIVLTLLPFASIPNQELYIQKIDASANTVAYAVAAMSGDLLNGGATGGTLINQGDYAVIKVHG